MWSSHVTSINTVELCTEMLGQCASRHYNETKLRTTVERVLRSYNIHHNILVKHQQFTIVNDFTMAQKSQTAHNISSSLVKTIIVIDANGKEQRRMLRSEEGFSRLLQSFEVSFLKDKDDIGIVDFWSLVDGSIYTRGDAATQLQQQNGELRCCCCILVFDCEPLFPATIGFVSKSLLLSLQSCNAATPTSKPFDLVHLLSIKDGAINS